jgi:hypothetical protein
MTYTNNQIFKVFLLTYVIINMDHGVIPACTSELKEDLEFEDFFLGLLGSLVFLGFIAGSLTR